MEKTEQAAEKNGRRGLSQGPAAGGQSKMEKLYIGIDMGGTKCAVVIGGADGVILRRIAFPSGKDAHPAVFLPWFYEAIDALLGQYNGGAAPAAIGVSCGGPLDTRRGVIQAPPNLPLWDEVPICALLSEHCGCPAYLQNDANACAIAEWRFGAGRGTRNMVFLTFGTGLGAGLILDGRLYEGTNGMAGEAGHLRLAPDGPMGYGKRGSFEGFCSGGGVRQLGERRLLQLRAAGVDAAFWPSPCAAADVTAKDICMAAQAGDETAKAIVEESAAYLGMGLSVLIDLFNPERIVIGSIFAKSEALFRPGMEAVIAREALAQSAAVCRVVPAQLGGAIGDVAALTIAIEFS